MAQIYSTELLNPSWWIDSLIGNTTILVILIEIWLLSFIRKIPNIKTFTIILFGINIYILIFSVFSGDGLTLSNGVLVLIMAIFGILAFGGFNEG